jgi:predicted nuclease with TOPRIM domain
MPQTPQYPEGLHALKAKQDALSEDMGEVKESLREIAKAMNTLSRLELRHDHTQETLERLHKRIDVIETRAGAVEVKLASQLWIERVIWILVAAGISQLL